MQIFGTPPAHLVPLEVKFIHLSKVTLTRSIERLQILKISSSAAPIHPIPLRLPTSFVYGNKDGRGAAQELFEFDRTSVKIQSQHFINFLSAEVVLRLHASGVPTMDETSRVE